MCRVRPKHHAQQPANCMASSRRACCQWLLDSCLEAMMRDSHLTLRAPAMPGATTRTGNPWSFDSSLHRRIYS